MKHLDLFSGIGGFALAAERVWPEIEHIFCDNEPFAQAVLKKHWPQSKIYGDIKKLTKEQFTSDTGGEKSGGLSQQSWKKGTEIGEFYLLTGGFPCQPFSQAGARRGTADDRHLWPEMLRVIREFHPRWVVAENVGGLVTWSGGLVLRQVLADLEDAEYEVQPFIIPAVAVNAPHRRDRIWFIARYTKYDGFNGTKNTESDIKGSDNNPKRQNKIRKSQRTNCIRNDASDPRLEYGESRRDEGMETDEKKRSPRTTDSKRQDKNDTDSSNPRLQRSGKEGKRQHGQLNRTWSDKRPNWDKDWFEVASRLCRVDDGIPKRLDRNPRLKALGNAIVPQVAEEIFKAIKNSLLI